MLGALVSGGVFLSNWGVSSSGTGADLGRPLDPAVVARRAGTVFTPVPNDPLAVPKLRIVGVPETPGVMAVWGASGRDSRGHIWFGSSAVDWRMLAVPAGAAQEMPSAHLFEYDPKAETIRDRGDAISQLRLAGLNQPGLSQQKIHSKIVEGADGYLYFSSSDETGADMMASKGPTFSSHLWRIKPGSESPAWDHILTAPECLIAVAGGGQSIFALGWFGHVVYSYHTTTKQIATTRVGSVGGHISSNFFTDARGHVYVPKMSFDAKDAAGLAVALVELDEELKEISTTRIDRAQYLVISPKDTHGITGVQPMADGSIMFVTHPGYLFQLRPQASGPASLTALGAFQPKQPAKMESLFTYDGRRYLVAVAESLSVGGQAGWDWVVHDLQTKQSTATRLEGLIAPLPISYPSSEAPAWKNLKTLSPEQIAFYGNTTRDDQGNFYLTGRAAYTPLVVRAQMPGTTSDEPIPAQVLAEYPDEVSPTSPEPRPPVREPEPKVAAKLPLAEKPPLFDPLAPDDSVTAKNHGPGTKERSDLWEARADFIKELRAILKAQGDRSASAISDLCKRSGRDLNPEMKSSLSRIATLSRTTVISLDGKVMMYRVAGLPEASILDELAKSEATSIGSRNGPRNNQDALVRAARRLITLPVRPPVVSKDR